MSAPSRRPEIRRRRTRAAKMEKLRKTYVKANATDKAKIVAKLYKMTPQMSVADFEATNAARSA